MSPPIVIRPTRFPPTSFGPVGAGLACLLYYALGFGAYIFPLLALCCCVASFLGMTIKWTWKPLWLVLFVFSVCALLDLQPFGKEMIRHLANIDSPGGIIGSYVISLCEPFGSVGAGSRFFPPCSASPPFIFSTSTRC